ncbi:unnamed protein product [Larinioides sclopetarius]|uniref:Mos1 transposase HTH domain-containing protein n=1 Tax=Larinioides sclopetarius TaxID=280406 RepID=A0AAV1YZ03_9ARAC
MDGYTDSEYATLGAEFGGSFSEKNIRMAFIRKVYAILMVQLAITFGFISLFVYKRGKNAVQARKKLTDVYGEDELTVRQCQNWFVKFRSGNFDVDDAPHSGRLVEADKGIS